jgi:iron complex outermembrane receptor protein
MTGLLGRPQLCAALLSSCIFISAPAQAADRNFNIPPQPLASALTTWARQANVQIFFPADATRGQRSAALRGSMSRQDALNRLIAGTGLRVASDDSKTVVLARQEGPTAPAPRPASEHGPDLPAADRADEAIVVTGIRQSLETAINIKRDSDAVVDAITAEDIGKFPDQNVADSLERVTGVQITRARGEGVFATIRGLPSYMNLVQFNGRTLLSAVGFGDAITRSFQYGILPTEFVGSLEVYKSPTADMEEGGLAGTVIVNTPRPLKIGRRRLAFNAQAAWESNTGKVSPRVSGIYSDVFADGRLGITLAASYDERETEDHTAEFYGFRNDPETAANRLDLDGDGVVTPGKRVEYAQSNYYYLNNERAQRFNALAVAEFQPSDNLNLYVETFYGELASQTEEAITQQRWIDSLGPTYPDEITMGPGIVYDRAVRFMADGVDVRGMNPYDERWGHLISVAVGGRFQSGPWRLRVEGSYTDTDRINNALGLVTTGRLKVGYDVTADDRMPSVYYGDEDVQASVDPNSYTLLNLSGTYGKRDRARNKDMRLDVERDVGIAGLRTLAAGFKYADRWQYRLTGTLTLTGAEVNQLLGGILPSNGASGLSAAPLMYLARPARGEFLGSYNGDAMFPGSWLVPDTKGFLERFSEEQLLAAGDANNATVNRASLVDVREQTYAGYAKATFGDRMSPVSGNVGVRVVKTDQTTLGVAPDLTAITYDPVTGRTIVPAVEAAAVRRHYIDVLPSANLRWNMNRALLLRAAASRTLSRPNLASLTATVSVNAGARTMNQQNPYLKPFRATNFDLGLEWYFGRRNLISIAAFHKTLDSLVASQVTTENFTITQINPDGSTQPVEFDFRVTRPTNEEGVRVRGVEFSYQQPFTFLPAPFDRTGIIANYTYLENSRPEVLTATSPHSFNLSAYYEDRRFSLRASYSYRDGFLAAPETDIKDGESLDAFGMLNASATLNLTQNLSATVQMSNILDVDTVRISSLDVPMDYNDPGRRIVFGLRGRF